MREPRRTNRPFSTPSFSMMGGPYVWIGIVLIFAFIVAVVYFKVLRPRSETVKPVPVAEEMMASKKEGVFPEPREEVEAPSTPAGGPVTSETERVTAEDEGTGSEEGMAEVVPGAGVEEEPVEKAPPLEEGPPAAVEEAPAPESEEAVSEPSQEEAPEEVQMAALPPKEVVSPREPSVEAAAPHPEIKRPYTIHVSSHRSAQAARDQVNVWIKRGYPAYTMPFDVEGKGRWYRVLIGRYGEMEEARNVADKIEAGFGLDYALPMKFPYVVEVSAYQTDKVAHFEASKLRELGYPAYVFPDKAGAEGAMRYRLFVGVFNDPLSAIKVSQDLKARGLGGSVVQP